MPVARPLPVKYNQRASVEALLGNQGKAVSEKVIGLIEAVSRKRGWPLARVEVSSVEDAEVENWKYVLIVLVFDSDFEAADKYLHSLYKELDALTNTLEAGEQEILQRKLFFDVATAI